MLGRTVKRIATVLRLHFLWVIEPGVQRASFPHSFDIPISWLENFPREEFQIEDRRAVLVKSLSDLGIFSRAALASTSYRKHSGTPCCLVAGFSLE